MNAEFEQALKMMIISLTQSWNLYKSDEWLMIWILKYLRPKLLTISY